MFLACKNTPATTYLDKTGIGLYVHLDTLQSADLVYNLFSKKTIFQAKTYYFDGMNLIRQWVINERRLTKIRSGN